MRPRRPTLLIAIAIAVIAVVAIAAYLLGSTRRNTASPAASRPATSVSSASISISPSADPTSDAAPTGCLGGPSRDAAMVIAAQHQAPHTAYGAVEVAAAFFRWGDRFPYPSAAQARQVSAALVAPNAVSSVKDIAGSYAHAGDITHGEVPAGKAFYVSTAAGLWLVSGTTERVQVTVNANYVIDGQLSPTKTAAIATVMVWTGGSWHLLSEQAPDTTQLANGGTEFTGGC